MSSNTNNLQPFIKWVGGKRRLMNKIIPYFSDYNQTNTTYVEPFIGGGAILFHLKPDNAIISDINPNLINVYQMIKRKCEKLIKFLKILQEEFHNLPNIKRQHYYSDKKDEYNKFKYMNDLKDFKKMNRRIVCAGYFIFLNKTGFNGMYRENNSGIFNIPTGYEKNKPDKKYEFNFDEELIENISKYFNEKNIKIFCQSYVKTLEYVNSKFEEDDNVIIYLDPPYYPSKTSKFTNYSKFNFREEEQEELCELFKQQHFPIYQSNSFCDDIKEMYNDYEIIDLKSMRSIAANKDARKKTKEVLIINN